MSATVYLIKTVVHFTCSGLDALSALKTVGDRHIFCVHRRFVLFKLLEHRVLLPGEKSFGAGVLRGLVWLQAHRRQKTTPRGRKPLLPQRRHEPCRLHGVLQPIHIGGELIDCASRDRSVALKVSVW